MVYSFSFLPQPKGLGLKIVHTCKKSSIHTNRTLNKHVTFGVASRLINSLPFENLLVLFVAIKLTKYKKKNTNRYAMNLFSFTNMDPNLKVDQTFSLLPAAQATTLPIGQGALMTGLTRWINFLKNSAVINTCEMGRSEVDIVF